MPLVPPPPPGYEDTEEDVEQKPKRALGSGFGQLPPPPPGYEAVAEEEPPKAPEEEPGQRSLFAGRKPGDEPQTAGILKTALSPGTYTGAASNVAAAAKPYLPAPNPEPPSPELEPEMAASHVARTAKDRSSIVPPAQHEVAPRQQMLFPPLPTQGPVQAKAYQPPRPSGPEYDPSLGAPVPAMQKTELPNEPVVSQAEYAIKHLPPTPGTKPFAETPLTGASKAALQGAQKDVSVFPGVPAGQPVTTAPGGPQTLHDIAVEATGPDWQRTAGEHYGKLATSLLKGTGRAIAGFEDAMGSATNLGIIGGLGAVQKIALTKWGPEVAKNIARLVDAKFAMDIGSSLATDRAAEIGDAIGSQDPEKMAEAVAGAVFDAGMLVHPEIKPKERGGGLTLGGMIPGAVEGATPAGARVIRREGEVEAQRQGFAQAAGRAAREQLEGAPGAVGPFEVPADIKAEAALPPPPEGYEPPTPREEAVDARAKELEKASAEGLKADTLQERVALKKEPPTPEEFRAAAEEELNERPEPQPQEPAPEGAPVAPAMGRAENQEPGEAAGAGERLPGNEPPAEGGQAPVGPDAEPGVLDGGPAEAVPGVEKPKPTTAKLIPVRDDAGNVRWTTQPVAEEPAKPVEAAPEPKKPGEFKVGDLVTGKAKDGTEVTGKIEVLNDKGKIGIRSQWVRKDGLADYTAVNPKTVRHAGEPEPAKPSILKERVKAKKAAAAPAEESEVERAKRGEGEEGEVPERKTILYGKADQPEYERRRTTHDEVLRDVVERSTWKVGRYGEEFSKTGATNAEILASLEKMGEGGGADHWTKGGKNPAITLDPHGENQIILKGAALAKAIRRVFKIPEPRPEPQHPPGVAWPKFTPWDYTGKKLLPPRDAEYAGKSLVVYKEPETGLWAVATSGGVAVRQDFPNRGEAVQGAKNIEGLTDWSQGVEDLRKVPELGLKVRAAMAEIPYRTREEIEKLEDETNESRFRGRKAEYAAQAAARRADIEATPMPEGTAFEKDVAEIRERLEKGEDIVPIDVTDWKQIAKGREAMAGKTPEEYTPDHRSEFTIKDSDGRDITVSYIPHRWGAAGEGTIGDTEFTFRSADGKPAKFSETGFRDQLSHKLDVPPLETAKAILAKFEAEESGKGKKGGKLKGRVAAKKAAATEGLSETEKAKRGEEEEPEPEAEGAETARAKRGETGEGEEPAHVPAAPPAQPATGVSLLNQQKVKYFTGAVSLGMEKLGRERGDIGLMVTPNTPQLLEKAKHFGAIAIDNGAFSKTYPFSEKKFRALLDRVQKDPKLAEKVSFVVAPDVPGDWSKTIEKSRPWLKEIRDRGFKVALAFQDGIEDVAKNDIPWKDFDVVFVGGSTEWKLGKWDDAERSTPEGPPELAADYKKLFDWARDEGKSIHVGRVNSQKRLELAQAIGASSADGTFIKHGPTGNVDRLEGFLKAVNERETPKAEAPKSGGLPSATEIFGKRSKEGGRKLLEEARKRSEEARAAATEKPAEPARPAREGSRYEGEDLDALEKGLIDEQKNRHAALAEMREALADANARRRLLGAKKKEALRKRIEELQREYENAYDELDMAGGDVEAVRAKVEGKEPGPETDAEIMKRLGIPENPHDRTDEQTEALQDAIAERDQPVIASRRRLEKARESGDETARAEAEDEFQTRVEHAEDRERFAQPEPEKPAAPERETYPDGRWIPKVGEKVYQTHRGFGGMPAYINGEIIKGLGDKLRVKLGGTSSLLGGVVVPGGFKSVKLDPSWTVEGDPNSASAKLERKLAEDEAKRKAENEEEARLRKEWIEKYGELTADDVKPGDVLELRPSEILRPAKFTVEKVEDGYASGFFHDEPDDHGRTPGNLADWRIIGSESGAAVPRPELKPEAHEIGAAPEAVPGERWTQNRGAMPGEPMAYLDGGEFDSKAAIIEEEVEGKPGEAVYVAEAEDGHEIGRFTGIEDAAKAAEAWADNQKGGANVPSRESADQVGAPGEGAMEAGRPEAVRGAAQERKAGPRAAPGAGAGEGPVRENGAPGERPGGGAEGGEEQPRAARPGERPAGGAAVAEGGGGVERGGGAPKPPREKPAEATERKHTEDEVPGGEATLENHPTSSNQGSDFRFTSPEEAEAAAAGGARARVSANLQAVRTLEQIKSEGRPATAEEQAILAKFSGWGSFPELFRPGSDISDRAQEVRSILGDEAFYKLENEAYASARRSTLNAHYTSPKIVDAMWRMARALGFKGGRLIEPAVGIGNFLALMPPELRGRSKVTGVEIDTTTGEMAKLLYPNTNIEVKGYQDLNVPDGFYDFAISNVPFGNYRVHDKPYNKYRASIHDYYFLKTLDKVRPGGAVMFITSTYTLDKAETELRKAMIEKGADFVAAIRLPAETFAKSAGTSVVTDIVILKKRFPGEAPSGPDWTETVDVPDPAGGRPILTNEYYVAHPEQVLGTIDRKGKMFPDSPNVTRRPDFEEKFQKAVEAIPKNVIEPRRPSSAFQPEEIQSTSNAKIGSSIVQNGKLYINLGDVMREVKADPKTVARVEKVLGVRDRLREVYDAQLSGKNDAEIEAARKALTTAYDDFVKKHGPISAAENLKPIADDPDTPYLLKSLETIDPKTKKVSKTDVFTKNTLTGRKVVEKTDRAGDAVSLTLRDKGVLDIESVAKLLGKTEQEVGKDLVKQGIGYDDPKDGWTPAHLYLSGNVRRKLREAEAAAKVDERYKPNVEALEKVQPKDLEFTEIYAPVGSPWIPDTDHIDFMQSLIGGRPEHFQADYLPTNGTWFFKYTTEGERRHKGRQADTKLWGTDRLSFMKLMEAAANGVKPVVRIPSAEDPDKSVVDVEATAAAGQKVEDIKRAFEDWVWDDPERRRRLHRYYNDNFNNIRRTDYDASHYKEDADGNYHFPGQNPAISMRPHQANAVWQAISTGRLYAGHEVGTGKTMLEATIAMESRRLGLARKPIITMPDSVITGFAEDFRKLYPAARILVTGSGLDAAKRKELLSRAASGDWDAILMTHDNLDKLTMRPEVVEKYINEELAELRAVKEAAWEKDPKKDNRIVKNIEKAELKLEAKLKELIEGKTEKDAAVHFEELGADLLIVDEAHRFKSLPIYSQMQGMKGIPTEASQRATNMFMRTRWLQEQNGGRGVVFASGTPIDNTLAELFNIQRYLQFNELRERGLHSFDAWARTFAKPVHEMEMKATGDYAPETRLAAFANVPDLQAMASIVMDVKRAHEVGELVRPHRKDRLVTVPMTDLQRDLLDTFRARAEKIKKNGRPQKGDDTFLSITNDAREAATDVRRVIPSAPDEPGSKVNALVAEVLKIHKERPGKTQLIFSDVGVHETPRGGPSTYKDIIEKLVKGGIPRDKIVNFSDLSRKGAKEEAVARIRSGDALVALGGSQTLGTGVNVQDKLYAVHHLDVPWTPSRLEQRDGRVWRQGNENKDIEIVRYATEGSFDTNMWQTVDRKSKAIAQFMEGRFKGREMEDPDTEKLSYAQIMAVASGSPELLEKINTQEHVSKLERSKKQHQKVQAQLQDSIKDSEQAVEIRQDRVSNIEYDIAKAEETKDAEFAAAIYGANYADRRVAGDALKKAYQEFTQANWERKDRHLGQYRGFSILVTGKGEIGLHGSESGRNEGEFYKGNMDLDRPESFWQSADNLLRNLPKRLENENIQIEALKENVAKAKASIGKPFRDEAHLEASRKRLAELEVIVGEKMKAAKAAREGRQLNPIIAETEIARALRGEPEEAAAGQKPKKYGKNDFFKSVQGGPGESTYVSVQGKLVDIPGAGGYQFFISKDPDASAFKRWKISEATSGLMLTAASRQTDAIERATRLIAENGVEKLKPKIDEHIAKFGISPRYAEEDLALAAAKPAKPEEEGKVPPDEQAFRIPKKALTEVEKAKGAEAPRRAPKTTEEDLPKKAPRVLAPVADPKLVKRLGATSFRATLGEISRRYDTESKAMEAFDRYFDAPDRMKVVPDHIEQIAQEWEASPKMKNGKAAAAELRSHAEQIDFIHRIETGEKQESPEKQKLADYLHEAWESRKQELVSLGYEAAKSWDLEYFPHIWDRPDEMKSAIPQILSRRPLLGGESYKKERTFITTLEGLEAGFKPIDWNPVRLSLLKMHEMDRSITGFRFLQDLQKLGLRQYVHLGDKTPGWRIPKDKSFQVWKRGDLPVKEAYDVQLMRGLTDFAESIGASVKTRRFLGGGRWGKTKGDTEGKSYEVERRFAGPESIVTHEIGHVLDGKYKLYKRISENETAKEELAKLADYRLGQEPLDPADQERFQKYIHQPDEEAANLIHGYIHAQALTRKVAPTAVKLLQDLVREHKELRPLFSIKPSLELGEHTEVYNVGGPVLVGGYAVPEPIADLLDNHLTPSLLANSKAFNAYRKTSQALLMARLGWSAFHLGFTTGDVTLSRLALAGQYAAQGNLTGSVRTLANIRKVGAGWLMDNPVIREWYQPGTQGEDVGAIVKALEMGGMRGRQSDMYQLGAWENFFRDLRRQGVGAEGSKLQRGASIATHPVAIAKEGVAHPVRTFAALVEGGSRYVLNDIVPRQKFSIAAEMARFELERLGKELKTESLAETLRLAEPERVKDVMSRVVDSVDNRLGQVVYDNLFLNQTLRHALHATVQSVGWNLGTWRELGGGVRDVKNIFRPDKDVTGKALPRVSHRMAYTVALPFFQAMLSSAIQYAYTGEGPKDRLDLIFPRNGRMNPDGSPARLSPATYMKDVYAYLGGFVNGGFWKGLDQAARTISHKVNPAITLAAEFMQNEDFYGNEIINREGPPAEQLMDLARFVAGSMKPYSFGGYQKERKMGASPAEAATSFIGLVPAPMAVSRSPFQQALAEHSRSVMSKGARTKEQAARSDLRRSLVQATRRGDTQEFGELAAKARDEGILGAKEIRKLGRSTAATARENAFKSLSLPEAIRIFKLADEEERKATAPILRRKIDKRSGLEQVPLAKRVEYLKEARALLGGTP